jgi:hypothetical protein
MPVSPGRALRHIWHLGRGNVQYGRCGCVWLYAAIACCGMMRSAPSSNPALSAQFLTSHVLACHREPVISARGSRARATRMASATRSGSVALADRFLGGGIVTEMIG